MGGRLPQWRGGYSAPGPPVPERTAANAAEAPTGGPSAPFKLDPVAVEICCVEVHGATGADEERQELQAPGRERRATVRAL